MYSGHLLCYFEKPNGSTILHRFSRRRNLFSLGRHEIDPVNFCILRSAYLSGTERFASYRRIVFRDIQEANCPRKCRFPE